jgi:hypothetical protein
LKADAVVVLGKSGADCLGALSAAAGPALGRVVAICDVPEESAALRRVRSDVVVLPGERGGLAAGWNRGLFLRERDVLLLDGQVGLAEGALAEMLEVLHASDRVASVRPLTAAAGRTHDCPGVPRETAVDAARGRCLLLRHVALNMIGALDPAFASPDDALEDWSMRAARMGLRHLRANRARAAGADAPALRPPRSSLLLARHPFLPQAAEAALAGAEPHAAEHCLGGRVRVCASLAEAAAADVQVLHLTAPVTSAGELLAVLECRCHLVLDGARAYGDRALLFAAARSAQAVIAASEQERSELISAFDLEPSTVEAAPDAAALAALYQRTVDAPSPQSLRYRSQMIDFLRSRNQ